MQFRIDPASRVPLPTQDQQAINHTLNSLQQGFLARDANMLEAIYAHDADWVNAFGSQKRGAAEIVAYLRSLFEDANFNAGTLSGLPEITIRVLTPDTVVVSGHLRIRGQRLLDGGVIDERDNYSIRVLVREADGRWPIISEMFMDANREQTFAGHS